MLFVALFALSLAMPHAEGWTGLPVIVAFTLVMGHLLEDLREPS